MGFLNTRTSCVTKLRENDGARTGYLNEPAIVPGQWYSI
jgi:hypothetical protein